MRAQSLHQKNDTHAVRGILSLVATAGLLLAIAPMGRAQSVDFSPAALAKQRNALILKATHAPIADLQNDLDHLAVLSETCRVESGARACGLSEKPLANSTVRT